MATSNDKSDKSAQRKLIQTGAEILVTALLDDRWPSIEPHFQPLIMAHVHRVEPSRAALSKDPDGTVLDQQTAKWADRIQDAIDDDPELLARLRSAVAAAKKIVRVTPDQGYVRGGATNTAHVRSGNRRGDALVAQNGSSISMDKSRRFNIALPFGFIWRSTKTVVSGHPLAATATAVVLAGVATTTGTVVATHGNSGAAAISSDPTTHLVVLDRESIALDANPPYVTSQGWLVTDDLALFSGGLQSKHFGTIARWTSDTAPTREACLADVQTHGTIFITPLNAGDEICATSQGGRVAFLHTTKAVPQRIELDVTVFTGQS